MKADAADLGTLWEDLRIRFEMRKQPVPKRWRLAYQVIKWVLIQGACG
jgi:hypothetical protein